MRGHEVCNSVAIYVKIRIFMQPTKKKLHEAHFKCLALMKIAIKTLAVSMAKVVNSVVVVVLWPPSSFWLQISTDGAQTHRGEVARVGGCGIGLNLWADLGI